MAEPEPEPDVEPEPTILLDEPVSATAGADDDGFPIAGYDSMRSSQIVAMLGDLDLDELDMVQEREEQGKNRSTVLRRVVERIELLEAEEDAEAPLLEAEPEPEPAEEFPAAADADFAARADDGFPIADYDSLSADEIISVLDDLEDDELDLVAEREEQGQNRAEILDYIDDMFEEVDDGMPEPPPPPPPAPRAVSKKAPAKKVATAKKAPVKKVADARAVPVKKAAVKKAAAGRVAATPRPRKSAVAKAPAASRAVSSPGTKAAGRRSTAPVAKVAKAPAKAVTAKIAAKAVTARKVAAKKAAAPRKRV